MYSKTVSGSLSCALQTREWKYISQPKGNIKKRQEIKREL